VTAYLIPGDPPPRLAATCVSRGDFAAVVPSGIPVIIFRTATEEKRFVPGEFGFGDFQSRQKETPDMIPQSREYPIPWGSTLERIMRSAPFTFDFRLG
jgi:hypothetical protein